MLVVLYKRKRCESLTLQGTLEGTTTTLEVKHSTSVGCGSALLCFDPDGLRTRGLILGAKVNTPTKDDRRETIFHEMTLKMLSSVLDTPTSIKVPFNDVKVYPKKSPKYPQPVLGLRYPAGAFSHKRLTRTCS